MAPYAIAHLGSLLNSKRKKVAFLGPVFTKALLPIAQALQLFSVPQVRDYYKIEVKRRSGEVSLILNVQIYCMDRDNTPPPLTDRPNVHLFSKLNFPYQSVKSSEYQSRFQQK